MIRTLLAGLFALISASTAASQAVPPPSDGSNLKVYLLTMGPGDQVWEKFGHNAIWIHDDANVTDIVYHWGLFDFADANFLPNFIKGRMRYSMGAFGLEETLEQYRRANRTVWVQELNLLPAERLKLAQFTAWNVLPENRFYRYDYYRDNCSTRVRDAIDGAIGGAIRNATTKLSSGTTYRSHTARLTQDDWPVFTGTMIGLGQPVDRGISVHEEMFLPVRMKERLRDVKLAGGQPLVLNERVLVQATRPAEATEVDRGMLGYLVISLAILLLGYGLWILGKRGASAGLALSLAVVWSLVAGIAGTALAFLWGFTDHLYSYRNENILQLNPLSIVVAIALISYAIRRRRNRAASMKLLLRSARIVAGLAVLGFALQLLPVFDQVNGNVIALALPLHLGLLALLTALEPA